MAKVPEAAWDSAHRFGLRTSRTAKWLSIRVEGEIVQRSAHHLEETLLTLAEPRDEISIDLTGITRIDQEGLEALIRSGGHADSLGARITLMGVPSRFRTLLELCDSRSTFAFIEGPGIATSSFGGRSTRWT